MLQNKLFIQTVPNQGVIIYKKKKHLIIQTSSRETLGIKNQLL